MRTNSDSQASQVCCAHSMDEGSGAGCRLRWQAGRQSAQLLHRPTDMSICCAKGRLDLATRNVVQVHRSKLRKQIAHADAELHFVVNDPVVALVPEVAAVVPEVAVVRVVR